MNKFLLLTTFVGVVVGCSIPSRDADCGGCAEDIGTDKCEAKYADKASLKPQCRKFIDCRRAQSRQIELVKTRSGEEVYIQSARGNPTTCPNAEDREEVCLKDFTGKLLNYEDRKFQCKQWAKRGYCKTNKEFMIPYCMTSCCNACKYDLDWCPNQKTETNCLNKYLFLTWKGIEKCAGWAYAGECEKNPVWMKRNCAASCCPLCKPKPPAKIPLAPRLFFRG